MLPVIWNLDAIDDLNEITDYINEYNPWAASRLAEAIRSSTGPLPQNPLMYRQSERISGCREIVVQSNYIVIYRVDPDMIRIMRVVHGRRRYL